MQIGELWGYTSGGLFTSDDDATDWTSKVSQQYLYSKWTEGDMRYVDINNDGKIDIGENTFDDPGDRSIIGNSTPRFSYGINMGLNWKGLNFLVLFQGIGRRDLALPGNMFFGFDGNEWRSSSFVQHLDHWTPENKDAFYPKPYMSSEHNKNTQTQTRYLQDGSYLRLKNAQIGYTVPKTISQKIFLEKIHLYFSGDNLFTYTKLSKIFDPEGISGDFGTGKIYPISKSISLGANITF